MKEKRILLGILTFLSFLIYNKAESQITLGYYTTSTPALNTYSQVMNGSTTPKYLTVQYNNIVNGTNYPKGWSLSIRANGNFSNGISSIPSQYISLQFNSVVSGPNDVDGRPTPLTGTDAILLESRSPLNAPPTYYMAQNFDLIIQEGIQQLVPTTGTYSTLVTLTLKDGNGEVIATNNNVQVSFNINFSNSCTGLSLAASFSNMYNFSTYNMISSGGIATDAVQIQYNPNSANCMGWSLKVRANGNFTNGSYYITPDHVSLQFDKLAQGSPSPGAIGISPNPVELSTADVTLINQSNAPFQANTYTSQDFNMLIQGGNYLQKVPTGTYFCPLTFSVYNLSGQLVSTANVTVSFQISYNNSYSYSVTLANSSISFLFSVPTNYINGLTVTQPNGLSITGYSSYQVVAKTLDANLSSGSNTIPVSVIQLANSSTAGNKSITSTTINLSTSDQTIITNSGESEDDSNDEAPASGNTTQYTLQFTISGGNQSIVSANPGTYSTQLIFEVLPF
ncbi:MAG: hypothetical protein ACYCOO_09010 [Chitinophagaceae bacterium]